MYQDPNETAPAAHPPLTPPALSPVAAPVAFAEPQPADAGLPPSDGPEAAAPAAASRRPSPVLLGLLVVAVGAFGVWKVVLDKDPAVAAPVPAAQAQADTTATSAPASGTGATASAATAKVAPTGWAAAVPTTRTAPATDANSIDTREIAPARFGHQVKLVEAKLAQGEGILSLRIQPDGTLVALVSDGTTARYVATKNDLDPTAPPTADAVATMRALQPSDIEDRVPTKLLRAVERAKGVAPGLMILSHDDVVAGTASAAFGDKATWTVRWLGARGTLVTTADGHEIKAVVN